MVVTNGALEILDVVLVLQTPVQNLDVLLQNLLLKSKTTAIWLNMLKEIAMSDKIGNALVKEHVHRTATVKEKINAENKQNKRSIFKPKINN